MDYTSLSELGLPLKEAKVYLAVLELGGAPVREVAKKAGVDRVNCYHLLDNLTEKQLVSCQMEGRTKTYLAAPPETLVTLYEEKLQTAKKLLPELLSITNNLAFKPTIQYHEGIEGITKILERALSAQSEIIGFTHLEALVERLSDFLPHYTRAKVKLNSKTRLIASDSPTARRFVETFYPNTPEARALISLLFIPPEHFAFENEVIVFDKTVAIISLTENELLGVTIESSIFARTMSRIFELSWLGAERFAA
ncbi:hypothetical protein CO046_04150 [Candidatus Peregrinibacteria bacterium CG_4_9_14_0_2_um_filter_53_11]|nr:MAG: hypothetical protein CO046_04150 [Candidatus Peregrinibacteria bacterium CG_4_9_14_0_2_um_filter_53_11]